MQEGSNCAGWEGEAQEVQEAGRGEGGGEAEHQGQGGNHDGCVVYSVYGFQYNLEKPINDDDDEEEDDEDDTFGTAKKREEEDDDPIMRE